jgi:hypothetical protein
MCVCVKEREREIEREKVSVSKVFFYVVCSYVKKDCASVYMYV